MAKCSWCGVAVKGSDTACRDCLDVDTEPCEHCGQYVQVNDTCRCSAARLEEARKLLMEWQGYARTMAEAGIIAGPSKLDDRTTGFLDATAV